MRIRFWIWLALGACVLIIAYLVFVIDDFFHRERSLGFNNVQMEVTIKHRIGLDGEFVKGSSTAITTRTKGSTCRASVSGLVDDVAYADTHNMLLIYTSMGEVVCVHLAECLIVATLDVLPGNEDGEIMVSEDGDYFRLSSLGKTQIWSINERKLVLDFDETTRATGNGRPNLDVTTTRIENLETGEVYLFGMDVYQ